MKLHCHRHKGGNPSFSNNLASAACSPRIPVFMKRTVGTRGKQTRDSRLDLRHQSQESENRTGFRALALIVLTVGAASCFCWAASAHEITATDRPHNFHELWSYWGLDPWVLVSLAGSALWYAIGLMRMWRARPGAGIQKWEACSFAFGWLALVIALVSPLHPWGSVLFAAHMTQHEILMLIAAPLMVLGHPAEAFLKAIPHSAAGRIVRWAKCSPLWRRIYESISNVFIAWVIHAAVLWVWHIPALFQATLDHDGIHAAQHLSFFGSALLFWWAAIHSHRAAGYGAAVLYMFTTAVQSGLLGAMIALARGLWYPAYTHTAPDWGLSPLEDQQLGGLIMWIPAGLIYIVAGMLFMWGWIRESERRVARWQLSPASGNLIQK
jgi:putative membrane protein